MDGGKYYEPCDKMASIIEEIIGIKSNDMSAKSQDSLLFPKSFNDLISDVKFLETINVTVETSAGEILLMTLKYAVHNYLSVSALVCLLRVINCIFKRPIIFETKYMLDKIFNPQNNVEFHAICPNCKTYVGELKNLESFITCVGCGEKIDLSKPSSENFFVTIDPSDSIADLLNDNLSYYEYVVNERVHENGNIRDVYDGRCYREFVQQLPKDEKTRFLTAIFNTDGANRFESSRNSIWPVYLMINELPPQTRMNNLIVFAFFFGREKPEMTAFLDPFVQKMNQYSSEGIECRIKGIMRKFKLYAICSCVDAVARAPMQGLKQFNGHHGCNWCLHPGVYEARSMRYPMLVPPPKKRTKESMIEFLNDIVNKNVESSNGVLYGSQLLKLRNFNIVVGFVVDPMHLFAGVVAQITKQLLRSLPEDKINIINMALEKIKVPTKLGRLTRSLDEMENWKALEWEYFVTHYSIPVFELVLSKDQLKYWSLLVESVHILNGDNITFYEIAKARSLIVEFCFTTQHWFSLPAMTFNVHQLLHVASSVLDWGPLWAHSAYPFEAANHDVLRAIKSANGVNQQIIRYVNLRRCLTNIYNCIYQDCSEIVKNVCDDINNTRLKTSFKVSNITYLGESNSVSTRISMKLNLSASTALEYSRIVKDNCLYTSNAIENERSANYFAILENNTFIEITSFLVDPSTSEEVTLYKKIYVDPIIECPHIRKVRMVSTKIKATPTKNIKKICIFITTKKNQLIIPLPNLLNY